MNLKEIRDEAYAIAREVGTTDADRQWTVKEMNSYINRVYRFIARETRCIRDAVTTSVCRIPVAPPVDIAALTTLAVTDPFAADDLLEYNTVGSWMYGKLYAPRVLPLSQLILDIDEVKWKSVPWKLQKQPVAKWQSNPFWERIPGYPTEYSMDYSSGYIALNYRLDKADTLLLTVKRMPLANLVADTDIPEFRVHYHDFMINGVLEKMYSKQDVEIFSDKQVEKYAAMFRSDVDEIKQQEAIFDQRLKVNSSMDAFR
jgi:hypothetical protein